MTTPAPRLPAWLDRAVLPLVLLLALALRVREALRAPLWYDELYTLSALQRPWAEVFRVMHADVHPPLHFVLGWAWFHFAHSDLAVRSLSIVFGLAGLAAAWALARALFGRVEAHLAALLLALHPWHVYVSQEARSYPVLWAFLTLAALGAWRWSESGGRRDGALFVAGAALALWTHYLAGPVLLAQFAWGAARFARERARLGRWIVLNVAVGLLFAPVLPLWWLQVHRTVNESWATVPRPADLLDVARREAFGALWLVPPFGLLAAWPLLMRESRRAASFALVMGPLAVLMCMALAKLGVRIYSPKYVLFALPVVMALVAAGAVRLPWRPLSIAASALLVLLAARSLALRGPNPEAEALGRARARLSGELRPEDLVFHADTHTWLFGRRYFPQARHRLELMGQALPYFEGGHLVPDSARAAPAEVRDAAALGRRWFAMASRPAGTDTRAAAALFDSLAGGPAETLGVVRVWAGGAGAGPGSPR
jgi:uncharacterized membrane protein